MVRSRAVALLRKPGQPRRPTFLELFFDLVFIFALTRVSDHLVAVLTSPRLNALTGVGQTLLLLLALLMVWFVTAWVTDLYDVQRPAVQLLVVITMFDTLLMAVALPDAFGERGMVFAGAYVAIHLGRGLFLTWAVRGHPAQQRAMRVLVWFSLSAVPWIAGALIVDASVRGVLWTLAVAIEYTGAVLFWPPLWRGAVPEPEWPVVAEYLAERYRLFFIIALGELILATGSTFSRGGFTASRTAAFVVSFATTVLLWRIYIFKAGSLLDDAIRVARDKGRLVRSALLAHLVMVTGVVAIAVGDALVIEFPSGHLEPAWIGIFVGGPALFLTGRALFEYAVFARVSRNRLTGLLLLAVVAPVAVLMPPLAVDTATTLILAGIAVSDAFRARGRAPELPSPPH